MNSPRMTVNTQSALRALLGRGADGTRRPSAITEGIYGLELAELTGMPSGTLFPLLERLVKAEWVERYWEADALAEAEGRPRRRYYRLTPRGRELAPQALAEASEKRPLYGRSPATRPGLAGGH